MELCIGLFNIGMLCIKAGPNLISLFLHSEKAGALPTAPRGLFGACQCEKGCRSLVSIKNITILTDVGLVHMQDKQDCSFERKVLSATGWPVITCSVRTSCVLIGEGMVELLCTCK